MVFTSASKAWNLAGLNCAAIVTADLATRRLLERLPEELPWRVGHLGVLAGIAAFSEGEPWLEEILGVLDHHRHYLAELLAARIPAIGYRPPEASYLAWLDCTALALGEDPSAVFLARGRVALSPGPSFGRPASATPASTWAPAARSWPPRSTGWPAPSADEPTSEPTGIRQPASSDGHPQIVTAAGPPLGFCAGRPVGRPAAYLTLPAAGTRSFGENCDWLFLDASKNHRRT
jgi:hypothetical protein